MFAVRIKSPGLREARAEMSMKQMVPATELCIGFFRPVSSNYLD